MPSYALIVEPDPGQAQLYRHIATAEGFEARVARDGEQAAAIVRAQGAPALTVLELSLARVDGFQVIAGIRKLAAADTAPVVVVSAFRDLREVAAQYAEEMGISALLPRSASPDTVRRTVKKVLAASAAPHSPAPPISAPPPAATVLEIDEERAEEVRLHRLDQMQLLDQTQDEELRRIAEEVAKRFGAPSAMISLVLEDKQWAKAHHGLTGRMLEQRGSPREESFCTHVVQGRQPLVVADAAAHPAFAENPLVKEGLVRGYAGVPLEIPTGDVLGALCIFDSKPITTTVEDLDQLGVLARGVAGQLELRSSARRQERERARLEPGLHKQLESPKGLFDALSYLSAVLDDTDDGVILLDGGRKVVFANQAAADLFALASDSLIGRDRDEVVREAAQLSSDPDDFVRRMRVAPEGPFALRAEFEMDRPRRRFVRWAAKPVQLVEGIGHVIVLSDITAAMDLAREREQLARTDPVTGLMNRRGGEKVLEREGSRAQRFGSRVSVALVDLDHFKQLNERHGHRAGDEVLRAVGLAIANAMRGIDVTVRWGGDELLAILPATGLEGARSFAERVRAQVETLDPALLHGVTLSVGVAELQPGEDWADAVRRADVKLYEAKDAGRNRVA